jgi:3-methyladenine DNA glycosylase AlkD
MKAKEVLSELKALGTEQNRKIYKRHGITSQQYGVSFANLTKLQRKIKLNQELAAELWASGNHDARVLATMVADPKTVSERLLDAWSKELDNYVLADLFSGLVAKSPLAQKKMEAWTRSKDEWIGSAGWNLVAQLAIRDNQVSNDYFEKYLEVIERDIHKAKNRVRYAMNGALIAIGSRGGSLQKMAIAAARRIGKVEVDHGETGCKTPDAVQYITKISARKRAS